MAITRSKQIRGGIGELDKVLKASGLALKDVQIVPVVGKYGSEFYIYYEDKDLVSIKEFLKRCINTF